jgi:hypothetical protein
MFTSFFSWLRMWRISLVSSDMATMVVLLAAMPPSMSSKSWGFPSASMVWKLCAGR